MLLSSLQGAAVTWMIRDGDRHIIGRKDYIRTEMWRFLRTMLASNFRRWS